MKKWILGTIVQFSCLTQIYSAYSGNPADPMLGNGNLCCNESFWIPKIGYQRDYITDRKLKGRNLLVTDRLDEFELISDRGTIAFDFCNRIEVNGSVGAGRLFMRARPHNLTALQKHEDFQFKDGTMWSVGGKAILFDWCNTFISASGVYQHFHGRAAWDGLHTLDPRGTRTRVHFHEWQFSVGAAYNFCCIVPYINVNFSGLVKSKITNLQSVPADAGTTTLDHIDLRQRRVAGLSLGTSFTPVDCFYVTVEAQVINERALTLQGQLRF